MGEPMTRSEGGRLPTLDALRGLASLAVMWFHFTKHAMPEIGDGALRLTGKYGWLGVQVFFVISGFVIPYSLQRANYSIHYFGKFLLKRITRLDPPYLLSIVFIIAYQFFLTTRPSYKGPAFHTSIPQLLCHFAYLNVVFGYEWYNGVFWSLAIEFQYYLLIGLMYPLLFSRSDRVRQTTMCALLALSLIPSSPFIFSYLGFFLLGFATLFKHLGLLSGNRYLCWVLVLSGSLVLNAGIIPALIGVATSLVISSVRLEFRLLSFFGLISYSLYLLHGPLGVPVLGYLQARTGSAYISLLLAVPITLLASLIYYVVVERPSQLLSSHFTYQFVRPTAKAKMLLPAPESLG